MKRLVNNAALVFIAVILLAACATPQNNPHAPARFVANESKILLMPVSVELFERSVGGVNEPRADWSEAATKHVKKAIEDRNRDRNLDLIQFSDAQLDLAQTQELKQIIHLHWAVARAMAAYQNPQTPSLPNKNSVFDWTLGPAVQPLARHSGADYALFVSISDSYVSAGKAALNIITGALFGFVDVGRRSGFATIVDLRSGDIAWFSAISGFGDLRKETGAAAVVDKIFNSLPDNVQKTASTSP